MRAELVWGRINLSPSKYYIHVDCVSLRQRLHEWQEWDPKHTQRLNSDAEDETVFYYIRNHSSEKKGTNHLKNK